MTGLQIDLFEGKRRKDAGMKRAIDHEHDQWKIDYHTHAGMFVMDLTRGITFTSEQVRAVVHKAIGDPHTPNVWGAMFNSCLKQWRKHGLVEFTGQFLDATNSQAHRRAIRLYRRS